MTPEDHTSVAPLDSGMWAATCDHGEKVWYLERQTEYLARRSLNAHLRHVHGEAPGA